MRISFTLALLCFLSTTAFAARLYDKEQALYGVELKSGKESSSRFYSGDISRSIPFPISMVKKGVTNYTDKCNNAHKDKRKFTPESVECKYHNDHLVESFVVSNVTAPDDQKKVSEYFLLGRIVYNRGSYGYYELVEVTEGMNEKKQKTITISQTMLDDSEVKRWTSPKFSKDSAFDKSLVTYTLTELAPSKTELTYHYEAETDHWLLNKEVSVPQVFASISKTIKEVIQTVEVESSVLQTRALASEE